MSDHYQSVPPIHRDPAAPSWIEQDSADATTSSTDTAKEQAANVKDTSVDAGKQVAGTAKEEAKNVASEAKGQAKELFGQSKDQLNQQAAEQQKRVASGIRSVGDELKAMADKSEDDGPATNLVREAAARADGAASWLDDRDPGSLLKEVNRFARERPGTFIAIAAVAGVLAGRLTRSIVSETKESHDSNSANSSAAPKSTPSAPPTTSATGYSDDFDSAGDYLGSGSTDPDPLRPQLIDEPPLSVGNEPYRSPAGNQSPSDSR